MGRHKKKLYWLGLLLLIVIVSVFVGGKDVKNINFGVEKNQVIIDDFRIAKIIDEKNNYYIVTAKRAVMDQGVKTAELESLSMEYQKGGSKLTLNANHGYLSSENTMEAVGAINGNWNEHNFRTGEDGTMQYDFKTEICRIDGNFIVNSAEGNILSDKALIYQKENILELIDNVQVIYQN